MVVTKSQISYVIVTEVHGQQPGAAGRPGTPGNDAQPGQQGAPGQPGTIPGQPDSDGHPGSPQVTGDNRPGANRPGAHVPPAFRPSFVDSGIQGNQGMYHYTSMNKGNAVM